MSTTAEAAPFDPREVVTDQTAEMYALNRYVVRGRAARLAAIDERVRQDYPEALGVTAHAAGEEARARMRAGLAEDVKGEAEAAVQGFRDRQALIADALKAVAPGGGNLDHARVQTLSSDLSNRLQNPPPSPEVGIDDRLAVIHSDWQRASLTHDAELAEDRIRFHDLRHSAVTYWAAAGVPLAKVGDWIGHSDERITQIYRHASQGSEEHALALLDEFDARHAKAGRDSGVTDTRRDHTNSPGTTGNDRDSDRVNQAEDGSTTRLADTG